MERQTEDRTDRVDGPANRLRKRAAEGQTEKEEDRYRERDGERISCLQISSTIWLLGRVFSFRL